MNNKDNRLGFKVPVNRAMLAGTVGLILVTVLSIAVTSYFFANKVLVNHARNIMENVAASTVAHSENYLRPARDAADVAQRLATENFLNHANPEMMESYFFEQLRTYHQFAGIYFGSPKGDFIYVSRNESKMVGGFRTKIIRNNDASERVVQLKWLDKLGQQFEEELTPEDNYDPRKRPWYQQATLEGRLIWTEPYIFFTSQKPGITTASAVVDEKGNVLGVIGVDIEIAQISDFLGRLQIGKHGKAFVMGLNGKLIAFPDISKLAQSGSEDGSLRFTQIDELDDPISQAAYRSVKTQMSDLATMGNVFGHFTVDGEDYLSIFKQFKGANKPWLLGLWVPEEDYLGELNAGMSVAALAAIIITVLASIFALAFSRSITRSIKWLSDSAEKVGDESFEGRGRHHSIFKELDDTLIKFEEMREKLGSADDRNKELQVKLIQSTSVKTAFIANVSHELRTPMNAIIGFSDILERQRFGALNTEQEDFLKEIHSAGVHLNDMISNLIEISKIEGGDIALNNEKMNLENIIDDTAVVLNTSMKKKQVSIDKNLGHVPEITSDKRVCRQIILNLLDNAVRFSKTGGKIKITTQVGKKGIVLSISDDGTGVPLDRLEEVFEPFVQLPPMDDNDYKGTGIGLTMARALAHLLGGEVNLCNCPDGGAQADLYIPLYPS